MENIEITNIVLDKKLDSYGLNRDDFVAPSELTVTITLSEYRQLVSSKATKSYDIDKANNDKWEREEQIRLLEKENTELKSKLFELINSTDTEEEE